MQNSLVKYDLNVFSFLSNETALLVEFAFFMAGEPNQPLFPRKSPQNASRGMIAFYARFPNLPQATPVGLICGPHHMRVSIFIVVNAKLDFMVIERKKSSDFTRICHFTRNAITFKWLKNSEKSRKEW